MLVYLLYPSHLRGIAIVVLTGTLVGVGLTWGFCGSATASPTESPPLSAVVTGSTSAPRTDTRRWLRALQRSSLPHANKVGGRAGNEIVTVNG
jgi:hypothetical protein